MSTNPSNNKLDDEKHVSVGSTSPVPSYRFEKKSDVVENEDLQEVSELQSSETLHRGLKARQISMIALGGAVGTGLIIGSGTALQRGGPLGILLGYSFVGLVCYCCMVALGEMAAWLPHKKGFSGYATRFVDPAVGFALGWNYLFKYLIVTPNNINAAGVVIRYWTNSVHMAIWMSIFIVGIFVVNLLGVRVFGELEFWFSSLKVLTLIGLLFLSIIIDLGGNPHKDRIGFRYWNPPNGPMGTYLEKKIGGEGPLSRFLGFWAVMVNALFAYIGTELIGVTVGEAQNPRKNIPNAIRRTFWRIVVFYVGGVFCVGLTVPSRDQTLFTATQQKVGAAASPFVVAAKLVGIKTLPSIINACILIFVLSAANSDLYIGSRTLYALALEGKAPAIFKKVNRAGVPYWSLIACTAFCGIVYLNVAAGSAKVFGYFVNLVSTFGAITWICICWCHIRFRQALKHNGIDPKTLPYTAPLQPWGSWFALIATSIITFFKGFDTLVGKFNRDNFITSYIGLPTFFVFWLGYKLFKRTKVIPIAEVDIFSGKRVIDEEEEFFLAQEALKPPPTIWQKIWDSL